MKNKKTIKKSILKKGAGQVFSSAKQTGYSLNNPDFDESSIIVLEDEDEFDIDDFNIDQEDIDQEDIDQEDIDQEDIDQQLNAYDRAQIEKEEKIQEELDALFTDMESETSEEDEFAKLEAELAKKIEEEEEGRQQRIMLRKQMKKGGWKLASELDTITDLKELMTKYYNRIRIIKLCIIKINQFQTSMNKDIMQNKYILIRINILQFLTPKLQIIAMRLKEIIELILPALIAHPLVKPEIKEDLRRIKETIIQPFFDKLVKLSAYTLQLSKRKVDEVFQEKITRLPEIIEKIVGSVSNNLAYMQSLKYENINNTDNEEESTSGGRYRKRKTSKRRQKKSMKKNKYISRHR